VFTTVRLELLISVVGTKVQQQQQQWQQQRQQRALASMLHFDLPSVYM